MKRVSLLAIVTMLALFPAISLAADDRDETSRGTPNVNFLPYEHNPVLDKGPAGAWDDGIVFVSHVVYKDRLFHLFYNGMRSKPPVAIGYATSPDGFTFTKSENPILTGQWNGLRRLPSQRWDTIARR